MKKNGRIWTKNDGRKLAARAAKRRDERKQIIEERLKENTEKINNLKKSKL